MALDNFRETFIIWDKANRKVYEPLRVSGSDERGRKLVVQVVNDGVVEDLTGTTLSLAWKPKEGDSGLDPFTIKNVKEGIFELFYTNRMLENAGVLKANFVLIDAIGRVVSEDINITVTDKIDDSAAGSQAELSVLQQALSTVNGFDERIERKADNDSVFSMANMGQDIKEAMTNGSVAVVGDQSVLTRNIVNKQVTPETTSFLEPLYETKDVMNNKTGTSGILVSTDGTVRSDASVITSSFFNVEGGGRYFLSKKVGYSPVTISRVSYYDDNGAFIIGADMYAPFFDVPSNAKTARISVIKSFLNTFFDCKLQKDGISELNYKTSKGITFGKKVEMQDTSFLEQTIETKNVMEDVIIYSGRVGKDSGKLELDTSTESTGFIPVEESITYFITRKSNNESVAVDRVFYYDGNKKMLESDFTVLTRFTPPPLTKFVRFTSVISLRTPFSDVKVQKKISNILYALNESILFPEQKTKSSQDLVEQTEETKNYMENVLVESGRLESTTGGVIPDGTVQTTSFIEVSENTQYYITRKDIPNELAVVDRIVFYDDDENIISFDFSVKNRFITPTGCKFVRLSIAKSVRQPFENMKLQIKISRIEFQNTLPLLIDNIPSYVKENAINKMDKVSKKAGDVIKFAFISDVHEYGNHLEYLSHVMEYGQLDFAIINGDLLNNHNSFELVNEKLTNYNKKIRNIKEPVLVVRGNHDGTVGVADTIAFTDKYFFDTSIKQNSSPHVEVGDKNLGYYFTDFEYLKLRVISTNSSEETLSRRGWSGDQLKWLAEKAFDLSGMEGWTVIVHGHHNAYAEYSSIDLPSNATPFNNILESAYSGVDYTGEVGGVSIQALFSSQGSTPLFYMFGHVHADIIDKQNGITHIATTCSKAEVADVSKIPFIGATTPPSRKLVTNEEYAFDLICLDKTTRKGYMYRMGAGVDRLFDY